MSLCKNKDTCDNRNLFQILKENPIDLEKLKKELQTGQYSSGALTEAALQYLDDCIDDQTERDLRERNGQMQTVDAVVRPELLSSSLLDVMQLLLAYGLDPNAVSDDGDSIMHNLQFIDNEYLAADALALFFENGGSYSTLHDGADLFSLIDFDVIFDALNQQDRRKYDALVHCWLVYLGYGAKPRTGTALSIFHDFDISRLKDHRQFTFALSHTSGRGEDWTLHIIDRHTFWEVARL